MPPRPSILPADFQSIAASDPSEIYPPLAGKVLVISGPTAAGKSATAMAVAARIPAEIISLDAIAVYRGMDIGTAKPSRRDQDLVQHHLIDVVDPAETFSVAMYLRAAHAAVDEIRQREKLPVFVGGTPMYLRAILRGFDPGPPADEAFRQAVEADVAQYGNQALHRRLAQVDPLSALKIDPGDVRRMIRALEVSYLTGHPISHRQIQHQDNIAAEQSGAFWLHWPRSTLHDRINLRTAEMLENGLIQETRDLLSRFGNLSRTAEQAVGYRETIDLLAKSPNPSDQEVAACEQLIAAHTRQLARRQETWFRSFGEIQSLEIDVTADDPTAAIVDDVCHRACVHRLQ